MGQLLLVSVPIGNIKDITIRAKEVLLNANVVFAEDTRNYLKLCQMLELPKPRVLMSFHDHSSENALEKFSKFLDDDDVVVVSDAGSPAMSDPSFPLVAKALELSKEVVSVSGVSSILVALEGSGLPPYPFTFHGFLPRKSSLKGKLFSKISQIQGTHVFFESVHRIEENLPLLKDHFAESKICIARELTKKFEHYYRFLGKDSLEQKLTLKGEFVLLIHVESEQVPQELKLLANDVLKSNKKKELSRLLGYILQKPSKEIYKDLLRPS